MKVTPNTITVMEGEYDGEHKACNHLALSTTTTLPIPMSLPTANHMYFYDVSSKQFKDYKSIKGSGRSVTLGADGYINVPINATVVEETPSAYLSYSLANDTNVSNGDGSFDIVCTGVDVGSTARPAIVLVMDAVEVYDVTITVDITSGMARMTNMRINEGREYFDIDMPVGTYEFKFKGSPLASDNKYTLGFDTGAQPIWEGHVTVKTEKVTTVDGSILYYDYMTNTHVSPVLPLSQVYTFNNQTIGHFAVLETGSFQQSDIAMINNDPTLLTSWGLGVDVGFSIGAKGKGDKYYAVTDDGEDLFEILGTATITPTGTYTSQTTEAEGLQAEYLTLNEIGVPIDTVPNTQITVNIPSSTYFTTNVELTETDLAMLNSNPNLVYEIVFNGFSLPSGNINIISMCGGQEGSISGSSVYDIISGDGVAIANYSAAVRRAYENTNYGASNLLLHQDATGKAIATTPTHTITAENNGKFLDTGFKPLLKNYTIEWNGQLIDGTIEQRVLTHSEVDGDKLYVDGALVSENPTLPASSISIKLNNVAPIGDPDEVYLHIAPFNAWSVALDEADLP